ncbi:MAG TPA: hypothetical protein VF755_10485, partial [Catenuloplanes sp.]
MVALRPGAHTTAPLRLAAVRSALAVGVFAVLLVEVAGARQALTAPTMALGWLFFLLASAGLAARRWPGRADRAGLRANALRRWRAGGRTGHLMIGFLGALVLAELVVALLAEPNNFDSQTYHLPKVEHWVAQRSLDFWPTAIHRQVTIPPGAEYLLLHLRLLTGGDALHNMVQFAAGLGCLLIASRLTAQLGGGWRAQLITVFVLGTTPMVVMQATSTQTDLVAAAWTGCVATVALDGMRSGGRVGTVLALGAATGLTAVTKTTGLLGVGPMLLLWGVAGLRQALRSRPHRATAALRVVGGSVAVVLIGAAVVGPFLLRVTGDFGNPLGPPRLRESIPMQRHDPAATLVNALRVAHTALDTPIAPVRAGSAAAISGFARLIGVDPQDRAITFGSTRFPVPAWYPDEDRVAFPVTGTLVLIALTMALARPGRFGTRRPAVLRAYAAAATGALLLYPVMIKWQPWGNRLLLYALVLATPMVGLWLDAVLRRHPGPKPGPGADADRPARRRLVPAVLAGVLVTAAIAATLSVSYGFPRRLV